MEQEKKWIREIIKHGSRKAADALIRKFYDEIYVFVYRQTGNREDALDLTQECFLAMLRSLPSFDAKKAGFRTWLYRIAAHKVIDMRRKQKHQAFPFSCLLKDPDMPGAYEHYPTQDFLQDSMEDFAQNLIEESQNKELLEQAEALVRLAEPQIQEIFRLRIYGEYSFPEIAATVSQPEAKIKSQYYRLLAKIRKELDRYGTQ